MVKLRESTRADAIQTIVLIVVFIVAIGYILYITYPDNLLVGIILTFGCLLLLVRWHSRTFGYRCANCDEDFEIPFWKDLLSFQGFNRQGGWKYLKCPNCNIRTTARAMTKIR